MPSNLLLREVPLKIASTGDGRYALAVADERANTEGTLLSSAARTATIASPDQTNIAARGVIVYFNLTSVPGVDTVQLIIEGKDPVSGTYGALLTGAAVATTQTPGRYVLYPGTTAGFTAQNPGPLPRTWRVRIVHSAGTSFTYSVGYALII